MLGGGGKPVVTPDELKKSENVCILICVGHPKTQNEIMTLTEKMGIQSYLIDAVLLKIHYKQVLKCYDLLIDDRSKEVYAEIIKSRLKGEYPSIKIFEDNQYFIWNRYTSKDIGDVYIDCGAYVGDSIEKYIWYKGGVFKKIIGFEPDPSNFRALEQRKRRLCAEWNIDESTFEIMNCGVSEKTETKKIVRSVKGFGSKIVEDEIGGEKVTVASLDDILKEEYTFLKADIESYEYKMLVGAQKGIKRWGPSLAICVYHNAIDLFSIALFIHDLVPEYKMAIRHHTNNWSETVLYAWIE